MGVQPLNASHANPYACAGSQQFKQLLTPGQAADNSQANAYPLTGCRHFTHTSLHLCRFPTIQTIPYAWAASRQFQKFPTSLRLIVCDHRKGDDS
ncbi:hypothetical protein O181_051631 [Austropuccinia psidii MF-1]|uniref:Uncharacterized protein n=1 Tax=Austropuccinia psidii MF-1 TaxID=1389203 RepID=A0A9Q3HNI0_9BASI|nr:hypothetical protein [Austropuccinia psidii MF-1]